MNGCLPIPNIRDNWRRLLKSTSYMLQRLSSNKNNFVGRVERRPFFFQAKYKQKQHKATEEI
jgi:hypothetical protein